MKCAPNSRLQSLCIITSAVFSHEFVIFKKRTSEWVWWNQTNEWVDTHGFDVSLIRDDDDRKSINIKGLFYHTAENFKTSGLELIENRSQFQEEKISFFVCPPDWLHSHDMQGVYWDLRNPVVQISFHDFINKTPARKTKYQYEYNKQITA